MAEFRDLLSDTLELDFSPESEITAFMAGTAGQRIPGDSSESSCNMWMQSGPPSVPASMLVPVEEDMDEIVGALHSSYPFHEGGQRQQAGSEPSGAPSTGAHPVSQPDDSLNSRLRSKDAQVNGDLVDGRQKVSDSYLSCDNNRLHGHVAGDSQPSVDGLRDGVLHDHKNFDTYSSRNDVGPQGHFAGDSRPSCDGHRDGVWRDHGAFDAHSSRNDVGPPGHLTGDSRPSGGDGLRDGVLRDRGAFDSQPQKGGAPRDGGDFHGHGAAEPLASVGGGYHQADLEDRRSYDLRDRGDFGHRSGDSRIYDCSGSGDYQDRFLRSDSRRCFRDGDMHARDDVGGSGRRACDSQPLKGRFPMTERGTQPRDGGGVAYHRAFDSQPLRESAPRDGGDFSRGHGVYDSRPLKHARYREEADFGGWEPIVVGVYGSEMSRAACSHPSRYDDFRSPRDFAAGRGGQFYDYYDHCGSRIDDFRASPYDKFCYDGRADFYDPAPGGFSARAMTGRGTSHDNSVRFDDQDPFIGPRTSSRLLPPGGHYDSRARPSPTSFGGRKGKTVKPTIFDGSSSTSSIESYLQQYEAVCALNDWGDEEAALNLFASVKGAALDTLAEAPAGARTSYAALRFILLKRFDTLSNENRSRGALRARKRRRNESFVELAQDISRLMRKANPHGYSPGTVISHFLDACQDEDMAWLIRWRHPETLQLAVEMATDYEASRMGQTDQTKSLSSHPEICAVVEEIAD